MKRFLLLSVVLLAAIGACYAQEKQKLPSYDDFIGAIGRKSEKVAVAESNRISDECKLSIMSELSIIRQQYRLKRDEDYYGKGGKPYFGETYTLAVKVNGGMYLSDEVVEPWKRDAEYQNKYASSGNYETVRYWTYQRSLSDSVYKVKDLGVNFADDKKMLPSSVNGDSCLYMLEDSRPDFGLEVDNMPGEKKGVMVWAYSKTNVQDSAMVVDLRQTSMKINAQADSTLLAMTPNDPEKIIGGVYMVPKIEGRGVVRYQLAGVAVKTEDDKWALQLLVMEDNLTESKGEAPESEPKKKGAKKKRTKSADSIEKVEEPTVIK